MTEPGGPKLRITVGTLCLLSVFEMDAAPLTCAAVRKILPYRARLVQARWSGEAAWIPMGALSLDIGPENPTSYPGPGELLLYPGGLSETEILFPYGPTRFASKVGQLAGNHFATIIDDRRALVELGRLVLWEGAQEIWLAED